MHRGDVIVRAEDYFDSAWYFDAGEFYLPNSGFTHLDQTNGVTWSAYRCVPCLHAS
jgi:hypothetical protein